MIIEIFKISPAFTNLSEMILSTVKPFARPPENTDFDNSLGYARGYPIFLRVSAEFELVQGNSKSRNLDIDRTHQH